MGQISGTWASGWLTGDVVTASEFKKTAGSVYDTTLGASAASIDVTGISNTYAHLMISLYARGDTAATSTIAVMRFNGDSAANYDSQNLQGFGATPAAAETFAGTSASVGWCAGNTAGANLFASSEIFIPHYAGSTNNKQYVSFSGLKFGTSTGNMNVIVWGGGWRSNAAINQITLLPTAGSFVAGTRVTIHALGA